MRKTAATDARFRHAVRTVAGAILADMDQLEREASPQGGHDGSPRTENAFVVPSDTAPGGPPGSAMPESPPAVADEAPAPPEVPQVEAPLRLGEGVLNVRVRGTAEEATEAARAAAAAALRPRVQRPDEYEWSRGNAGAAATGTPGEAGPDVIARRAAVKAAACRWVVAKRRDPASDAVAQEHRTLIAQAKALPNCYLWMVNSYGPMPRAADADADALAGCYDALADACNAASALGSAPPDGPEFGRALRFVAEAQSALRAMMLRIDEGFFDTDQRDAFGWVRQQAAERGTFLDRHMRVDDPADPDNWPDLRARVAAFRAEREQGAARQKARAALTGKVKYHAGRLRQGTSPDPSADWQKLLAALEELVADGVPPSDLQLREWLLPVFDAIPDGVAVGPKAQLVFDDLDRHVRLAEEQQDEAAGGDDADADDEASPAVRQVADLLRGRRVVLIGGEARPHAKRALERAFELEELTWLSGKVHSSFYEFEPAVARPETAVVLLAIRWSSHGFGEVRSLCNTYGKPLVRLPGGYNPEQVAQQIFEQVGEQLAAHA